MAENIEPPKKILKSSKCIILNRSISQEKAILKSTDQGIRTLMKATKFGKIMFKEIFPLIMRVFWLVQ